MKKIAAAVIVLGIILCGSFMFLQALDRVAEINLEKSAARIAEIVGQSQ